MMHCCRLYNFCIAAGLSYSLDSFFFEHALSCHRLLVADIAGVSWARDIFI